MKLNIFLIDLNFQKIALICTVFFQINFCNSQHYRNAAAYINDFGRNETFINASMVEYSKTIAHLSPENKVNTSSIEIVDKLLKLNGILKKNDRGFNHDVHLRDAIMELNTAVSVFLSTDAGDFNNYKEQSQLDFHIITENFRQKELVIEKLYGKLKNYENAKKEFGEKYNIPIKYFMGMNIYEYNTYQNLIFYKINVLDEKLMTAIKNKDIPVIEACDSLIVSTCNESLKKTAVYKGQYQDETLNNANILFSNFFLLQDKLLMPITVKFFRFHDQFQKMKSFFQKDTKSITMQEYNNQVRKYNDLKNRFYETFNEIGVKKNLLLNNWVDTNKSFLKNNCSFVISNYKYVDGND